MVEFFQECVPVAEQGDRESRRLWRHVTVGLKKNQINDATAAKRWIEQRQRDEAKYRQVYFSSSWNLKQCTVNVFIDLSFQENGISYQPQYFEKSGDDWIYKDVFRNDSF